MVWRLVVSDTAGNAQGELSAARKRKALWQLDAPATASFDLNGRHAQASLIKELQTDLVVMDDSGTAHFRGRLGSSGDDVDANKHDASFTAVDYRGMLGRRIIWPGSTTSWPNSDQADIAWQLINGTQSVTGGNLGITRAAGTTGVMRQRTYAEGDNIGKLITDLGDVQNGFDWEIDAGLKFQLWYPQRGANNGQVLTYGDNVAKVRRTVDTSKFANALRVSGASTLAATSATVSSFGPEGRWEAQEGDTSILDAATLTQKANGDLADLDTVTPSYEVTLTRGWWEPSVVWLGDTVVLNVYSGRLAVTVTERVTQVAVEIGDEAGEVTPTLTVGPAVGDLLQRLATYASRLTNLERT